MIGQPTVGPLWWRSRPSHLRLGPGNFIFGTAKVLVPVRSLHQHVHNTPLFNTPEEVAAKLSAAASIITDGCAWKEQMAAQHVRR